jgi:hypothetical protein
MTRQSPASESKQKLHYWQHHAEEAAGKPQKEVRIIHVQTLHKSEDAWRTLGTKGRKGRLTPISGVQNNGENGTPMAGGWLGATEWLAHSNKLCCKGDSVSCFMTKLVRTAYFI